MSFTPSRLLLLLLLLIVALLFCRRDHDAAEVEGLGQGARNRGRQGRRVAGAGAARGQQGPVLLLLLLLVLPGLHRPRWQCRC